jgi:type 1 glutamine amidotransferase
MIRHRFSALHLFAALAWFSPFLSAQQPAGQPEGTAPPVQREAGGPQGAGGRGRGGRGFPPVTHGLGMQAAGRVLEPAYDKTPPELPADLKSNGVLIFSKTNGFRDEPAIQASDSALAAIAKLRALPYLVTENGAVMNPDQLGRFNVVIWNNTSGDTLNEQQRAAFRSWVENGGTYIGIHGAGGDPAPVGPRAESFAGIRSASAWKWYVDNLVGAQFIGHAHIQPADIHIEDTKSRLTQGLPVLWRRADEWYAFGENPRNKPGYHVVASVNEKSYDPDAYSMGGDHPSVWWHCVGKGRALFSALGHGAEMYQEPLMIQFLDNAIAWALRQSGQACAGPSAP